MRQVQQEYLAQLFAALGSDRVTSLAGIRLGWGHYGEIGYPHPTYGAHTNSYWAFDDIAQGHASGLPTGVPACPVPGWIPGTSGPTQAQAFVHWYLEALLNYQQWQITTVRAHYAGPLVVLYGSRGVRPGQIDDAVAASLNGSTAAEIDSDLQRGFDYQRLVNGITDLNVAPCTTWLDCTFGNPDDASSDPVQWTPVHYLHYLASQRGLRIWSENTGHGSYDTMALCFKRMQTFDVHALLWAFHAELYSGRYATMDQYAQLIKQYQSAGRCRRNT